MIEAEFYSLMKRVFYEQEVYLLLDLTKRDPALMLPHPWISLTQAHQPTIDRTRSSAEGSTVADASLYAHIQEPVQQESIETQQSYSNPTL